MESHKIIVNRNCGIFSDLSTIFSGIWYCIDNSIKYEIEWYSQLYELKNEEGVYKNLFDEFFYQEKQLNNTFDFIHQNYTPYGFKLNDVYWHPKKDCEEDTYNSLIVPAKIIKDIKMFDSPFFNSLNPNYFGNEKVLGVHRRGTCYRGINAYLDDSVYFEKINEEFKRNNYDKIFIITDDGESLENFKKEYGNQLIYTDTRLTTDGINPQYKSEWDRKMVLDQCMRDVFYLAQTDYKILVQSNVSLWALLLNLKKDSFKMINHEYR